VTHSGLADAGSAIGGAGTGRTGVAAVGIFVFGAEVIGNSADYKSTAMQMGKGAVVFSRIGLGGGAGGLFRMARGTRCGFPALNRLCSEQG
jgi:hypothetical protein